MMNSGQCRLESNGLVARLALYSRATKEPELLKRGCKGLISLNIYSVLWWTVWSGRRRGLVSVIYFASFEFAPLVHGMVSR